MQNQLQEVLEDLETEREAKGKAEKQKKDLNEVSGVKKKVQSFFQNFKLSIRTCKLKLDCQFNIF